MRPYKRERLTAFAISAAFGITVAGLGNVALASTLPGAKELAPTTVTTVSRLNKGSVAKSQKLSKTEKSVLKKHQKKSKTAPTLVVKHKPKAA